MPPTPPPPSPRVDSSGSSHGEGMKILDVVRSGSCLRGFPSTRPPAYTRVQRYVDTVEPKPVKIDAAVILMFIAIRAIRAPMILPDDHGGAHLGKMINIVNVLLWFCWVLQIFLRTALLTCTHIRLLCLFHLPTPFNDDRGGCWVRVAYVAPALSIAVHAQSIMPVCRSAGQFNLTV